jgi:hypothetical protein
MSLNPTSTLSEEEAQLSLEQQLQADALQQRLNQRYEFQQQITGGEAHN